MKEVVKNVFLAAITIGAAGAFIFVVVSLTCSCVTFDSGIHHPFSDERK